MTDGMCIRDGRALEYIGIQGLGLQVFESDSKSSQGGEAAKWVIFLHWLSMACKSWQVTVTTLIGPQLEVRVQFRLQYHRKDVIGLERIQRKFIRMLLEMDAWVTKREFEKAAIFLMQWKLRGILWVQIWGWLIVGNLSPEHTFRVRWKKESEELNILPEDG